MQIRLAKQPNAPPCTALYKALQVSLTDALHFHWWSPGLLVSGPGLRTILWSPGLESPDLLVSGPLGVGTHAAPRKHCICMQGHALCCLVKILGGQRASGSTRLLFQAHQCPGSSATFSNPGKKNCGRFGRVLFFWGFMFGFKLGAVQHALTLWLKCSDGCHNLALKTQVGLMVLHGLAYTCVRSE